jgi:hypothetical protein
MTPPGTIFVLHSRIPKFTGIAGVCDTAHPVAASSAIPPGAKLNTEKIMGKHVSQSTRTVKDKLDNRLSKGKEIKKESTELNEEDLGQVTGGGGWNLAQNKRIAS